MTTPPLIYLVPSGAGRRIVWLEAPATRLGTLYRERSQWQPNPPLALWAGVPRGHRWPTLKQARAALVLRARELAR